MKSASSVDPADSPGLGECDRSPAEACREPPLRLASPRICWSKEFPVVAPGLGGGVCNRPWHAETEKAAPGPGLRGRAGGGAAAGTLRSGRMGPGQGHMPSSILSSLPNPMHGALHP